LSIYLFMSSRRLVWLGAASLFCIATFATVSRTGVLSLVVVGLVYLILRPRETSRFWPLLLPLVLAIKIAMPGVLGTFYHGFFPEGGLIAEQADGSVGSSRVASFEPALDEISLRPLLGLGYGTRIPSGPGQNSFILDDQWLATAMEVGLLGFAAWVWLFVRFLRKMFRSARRERGDRGWLFTSIAASTTGFAVGMVTYDAFSFIQVTFGLFVVLALGSAASALADHDRDAVPA
jgi:O-antigen ligase